MRMKDKPSDGSDASESVSREFAAKRRNRVPRKYKALAEAILTARVYVRWLCVRTEHVQRGMTAERVAEAIRRRAISNGQFALVTASIARVALRCEGIREYNDGYRAPWYALRLPGGGR